MDKEHKEKDGNVKNKNYFSNFSEETEGKIHRADNEPNKYAINPVFLLTWLGILKIQGDIF